jgi:RHS repeat-associated protein
MTGACPERSRGNAENRLINAAGVNYTYDGDGRRVKKDTGKLYWYGPDGEVNSESDLAGVWTIEHMYFNGKRVARRELLPGYSLRYHFSDHLGSASVITNVTETVKDESDYYPFGGERMITNQDPNQYKFTGKERDTETGLDYFGARFYSSNVGRFGSTDSLLQSESRLVNPQGWNAYAYALNNPLFFVDPRGNEAGYYYAPDGKMVAPTEKNFPKSDHPIRDTLLLGSATGGALMGGGAAIGLVRSFGTQLTALYAAAKSYFLSPGGQQLAQDSIEALNPGGGSLNMGRVAANFGFREGFASAGGGLVGGTLKNGATVAAAFSKEGSGLGVTISMVGGNIKGTLAQIEAGAINAAKGEGAQSVKVTATMVSDSMARLLTQNGFKEVLDKAGKGTGTFVKEITIKK